MVAACLRMGWKLPLLVDLGIRAGADAVIAPPTAPTSSWWAGLTFTDWRRTSRRGDTLVVRTLRDEMERSMLLLGVGGTAELRARGEKPVVMGRGTGSGMAVW